MKFLRRVLTVIKRRKQSIDCELTCFNESFNYNYNSIETTNNLKHENLSELNERESHLRQSLIQ